MPRVKDLSVCELYACRNPQHSGESGIATVTLPNEEDPVTVKICIYHESVLARGSNFYSVGRTYTGEIELRPIAAPFAAPPEETP